jgi:hypothetical protein
MDKFLGHIYCWFENLFGQNLAEHLWGYDCSTQDYTNQNQFNTIGLLTLGITAFLVIFYYYILNHPRFSKWWSWLIILGFNSVISLFVGFGITNSDLLNGTISECLLYVRNENGDIIQTLIGESNCWGFGAANMFVSILFFVVLSFCFKWRSSNCKRSPF